MSAQQAQALEEQKERTEAQDAKIEQIGEVVGEMGQVASAMDEELKRQALQIDDAHGEIDRAQDHLVSVNDKMKKTLLKVGRPVDKLCMDIVCLAILLGLAAVIYNMANSSGDE